MSEETIGQLFDRLPRGQWTAVPEYGVMMRAWPQEATLEVLPPPPSRVGVVLDEDSYNGQYYRSAEDDDDPSTIHYVEAHLWQAYRDAVDAENVAMINLRRHIDGRDPT